MNLYTFIMDFRGGTYIDQLTAPNENEAVLKWAKQLNVRYIGTKTKQLFIKELPERLKEFAPKPIDEIKNVWCFTYQFKTGYGIINIIKTSN